MAFDVKLAPKSLNDMNSIKISFITYQFYFFHSLHRFYYLPLPSSYHLLPVGPFGGGIRCKKWQGKVDIRRFPNEVFFLVCQSLWFQNFDKRISKILRNSWNTLSWEHLRWRLLLFFSLPIAILPFHFSRPLLFPPFLLLNGSNMPCMEEVDARHQIPQLIEKKTPLRKSARVTRTRQIMDFCFSTFSSALNLTNYILRNLGWPYSQ